MPISTPAAVRSWIDPDSGRRIRQLTSFPDGAACNYFRLARNLPDGRILFAGKHPGGNYALVDLDGFITPLNLGDITPIKLRPTDGRLWYQPTNSSEIWMADLPDGTSQRVADAPEALYGVLSDISCDGKTLLASQPVGESPGPPLPTTMDLDIFWRFINRKRRSTLLAIDLATGEKRTLVQTEGVCCIHVECSPVDPALVRYCHDMYDAYGQRVWTVRTDGSPPRPIRPQVRGEVVTHEFWWSDPNYIGYTYQDRIDDPTTDTLPWCEYSPRPTQLGIADLTGKQIYLSDPLNHYHTHLYVSPDGKWVCGEGTDHHFGIFIAPFDWKRTRIDLVQVAAVHTPYVPFRGQHVDAHFTHDSKWLVYGNQIDGKPQVCAVEVDA